ncbi:MAG: PPE family protein [Mycobacterium sp.]|uniref:PPE family protein n=1 Tax=Mycobacterium sp. TaxID=1785 RepID=UPI003C4E36BF
MDYGALPPEINSARMYSGPGSPPMLAAAAAWDGLAAELSSTASSYQSVIERLAGDGWLGPASASMAAAVTPYMTWVSLTGAQAEHAATQASAAAAAYEAAFAATVPPAAVAANRVQLATLVATNFLGQNTPAIAATEAHYGEIWAQDAAAMYAYAASSAAASVLKLFGQPPQTTNPAGQADQAGAVAQATATPAASGAQSILTQLTSAVPNALQSLAAPLGLPTDLWSLLDSNFVNGFVSAGYTSPAIIQQTVTGAMADINAVTIAGQPGATALPPMGAGTGNATWLPLVTPNVAESSLATPFGSTSVPGVGQGMASAGMTRGVFVGRLSVPQSWVAATQVENHAGAALAGGGWNSTALPESSAGVPGMPGIPAASTAGRHFGSGPRYGFQVTVMPRPPAAG